MVVSHRCRRWPTRARGTAAVPQLISGTKERFQRAELDAAQDVAHVASPPDVGGGDGATALARAADQPPQPLSRSTDIRTVQDVECAHHTDGGTHGRRGLGCGSLGCGCLLRVVVEMGVDEVRWYPGAEV